MNEINYHIWWDGYSPAACIDSGCWCEAPRIGAWILEPVNTWTNLAFVLMGFYMLWAVFIKKDFKYQSVNARYPLIFALGLIATGLGSFFFHASRSFEWQWFDLMGMYILSLYFLLFNFVRSGKIHHSGNIIKNFQSLFFLGLAICGVITYYFPGFGRYLFGIQILFTFIHTILIQRTGLHANKGKYLAIAAVLFVVAVTAWNIDRMRIICHPYALMNGHGIWHLLDAFAAYYLYRYFTSGEKIPL